MKQLISARKNGIDKGNKMKKIFTVAVQDDTNTKDTLFVEAETEQIACDKAEQIAEICYGMYAPIEIIASYEGVGVDVSITEDYRLRIMRTDNGHLKVEERK